MAGVLRQLIRELKRVNPKKPVRDSLMYNYILEQYRIHQVTAAKHCKQQQEMKHLAETYLCLLESNSKQAELSALYRRGERSIADSAALVGLRLPEEKS